MQIAVLLLQCLLISYVMYRTLRIVRFEYARYCKRKGPERRLLAGFFLGYVLAMICAFTSLWMLKGPDSNQVLQSTAVCVTGALGAGPLLFIVCGLWKEAISATGLKRSISGKSRLFLYRSYFGSIAAVLTVLLAVSIRLLIQSAGVLSTVDFTVCATLCLTGLMLAAFYSFFYYRKPCRTGQKIQIVLSLATKEKT